MQVSKWGNSLAVRIPAEYLRHVGLSEGDQVEAYVVQSILPGEATLLGPDGRHVLRPAFQSKEPAPRASAGAGPNPAMRWDGAGGSRGS